MKLVKLPSGQWINPQRVLRIIENTGAGTVEIRMTNDEWITVRGFDIDQVASVIIDTDFKVIDDELTVNKTLVEAVVVYADPDGVDPEDVKIGLQMSSRNVHFTTASLEAVLGQLDGVPFFRGEPDD